MQRSHEVNNNPRCSKCKKVQRPCPRIRAITDQAGQSSEQELSGPELLHSGVPSGLLHHDLAGSCGGLWEASALEEAEGLDEEPGHRHGTRPGLK